jgi:signal transduction histidine kinase
MQRVAPAYRPILERYPVHSLLAVPLRVRGRVIGTLAASRDDADAPYTAEDQQFLEALADRAAQAVENAQLYEREQAAREQAEAAVRVRDEFFSVASHELKTPMTALRGFAQLELRRLRRHGAFDQDRVVHAFQTIMAQTDRLNRLVTELLDVSRIQTGKLRLDPVPGDLTALVHRAAEELRLAHPDRELVVAAPDALPFTGDPVRLEQVLLNLLDNAVKFSPAAARIDLTLEATDGGRAARIGVRDRGIGIPEEHRERVFERSFQVSTGGVPGGGGAGGQPGMGLGLFISRQIVELHGGRIVVEAPPDADGGTQFVVTLPLG